MMTSDTYLKILLTIIAVCLAKLAFFSPPPPVHAQFPFTESSGGPMDVNLKSIDTAELYVLKNGDVHLGDKNGPKLFEKGAFPVRIVKE